MELGTCEYAAPATEADAERLHSPPCLTLMLHPLRPSALKGARIRLARLGYLSIPGFTRTGRRIIRRPGRRVIATESLLLSIAAFVSDASTLVALSASCKHADSLLARSGSVVANEIWDGLLTRDFSLSASALREAKLAHAPSLGSKHFAPAARSGAAAVGASCDRGSPDETSASTHDALHSCRECCRRSRTSARPQAGNHSSDSRIHSELASLASGAGAGAGAGIFDGIDGAGRTEPSAGLGAAAKAIHVHGSTEQLTANDAEAASDTEEEDDREDLRLAASDSAVGAVADLHAGSCTVLRAEADTAAAAEAREDEDASRPSPLSAPSHAAATDASTGSKGKGTPMGGTPCGCRCTAKGAESGGFKLPQVCTSKLVYGLLMQGRTDVYRASEARRAMEQLQRAGLAGIDSSVWSSVLHATGLGRFTPAAMPGFGAGGLFARWFR